MIKSLPFEPATTYYREALYPLRDDGSQNDLNEISGDPDHVHPDYPIDDKGYPANPQKTRFGMFWNVADDMIPEANEGDVKRVAVTVTWVSGPQLRRKYVTIPTVIGRGAPKN